MLLHFYSPYAAGGLGRKITASLSQFMVWVLFFLVLLCQHRYFLLLSFDDRYLQTSPVVAD
jgi:hypothetical protein